MTGPPLAPAVCAAVLAAVAAHGTAGDSASPRLYELTTVTGMPHLDENLRYATRTEQRCLDVDDLAGAFWMLREPSLQDCRLVPSAPSAERGTYVLRCDGGAGTTGRAEWHADGDALTGTLHVRLGGKNMTFYQRVTARPLGACR